MNYSDAVYAIMFSKYANNLNPNSFRIEGDANRREFLDSLLLNLDFISDEIDYLDKSLLKLIAYERALGKDTIIKICAEDEIELDKTFFEKCQDDSVNEVKLVNYVWKALENGKKINYETAKFSEADLMIRLDDEIIKNSAQGNIGIGEIYKILAKEK